MRVSNRRRATGLPRTLHTMFVLALSARGRWWPLARTAMVKAGAVFMTRFGHASYGGSLGPFATCAFAWAFFSLFVTYALAGAMRGWFPRIEAVNTTAASGAALVALWLAREAGSDLIKNKIVAWLGVQS